MLHTVQWACTLPKAEADALNAESGRIYTDMLVSHYRLYRKQGVWLTRENGERWEDRHGGPTTLHAHSRDAAQQGFSKACKTARSCRQLGLEGKYPSKRKRWRTTCWKQLGIRLRAGVLLLARARGLPPMEVALPSNLLALPATAFLEARLVGDRAARHYTWHLVIEDGTKPTPPPPGDSTAAVDLGEIHPAALTDGQETVILSCRALRANGQYTAKRLSELRAKQARKWRSSRALRRLQRRTSRFLAKQKRRARDLEPKISRAVVNWAKERQVSTLVIGDVRDVADGKRLKTKSQQKIGLWSHGRQRQYIMYQAAAAGIAVVLVEEAYTSQTCPGTLPDGTGCLQCDKPKGRVYRCPACGFDSASRWGWLCQPARRGTIRGNQGTSNRHLKSIVTPTRGKRSRLDTADLARIPTIGRDAS